MGLEVGGTNFRSRRGSGVCVATVPEVEDLGGGSGAQLFFFVGGSGRSVGEGPPLGKGSGSPRVRSSSCVL